MRSSTFEWACDQCGDTKTRHTGSTPTGWRRVCLVDDTAGTTVLLRADFCSVECRDTWLKEHGLEKRTTEEAEA